MHSRVIVMLVCCFLMSSKFVWADISEPFSGITLTTPNQSKKITLKDVKQTNEHIGGPVYILRKYYGQLGGIYVGGYLCDSEQTKGHLLAFPCQGITTDAQSLEKEIWDTLRDRYKNSRSTNWYFGSRDTVNISGHTIRYFYETLDGYRTIYALTEANNYVYLAVFTCAQEGRYVPVESKLKTIVFKQNNPQLSKPYGDNIMKSGSSTDWPLFLILGVVGWIAFSFIRSKVA